MSKFYYFKKLPTILLESALIFLAVFLSFLADDYREEQNIREVEKESLVGIYEDLGMDSVQFLRNSNVLERIEKSGNKLLSKLDKGIIAKDSAEIYFQDLFLGELIVPNRSHYEALKNAGLIQEIENGNLRNSITNYYEQQLTWAGNFSVVYQRRHFKFVDDVKPFLSIRTGQRQLYQVEILDEEYFKNDPVWKSSLGESLGLVIVEISTLKILNEEIGKLRNVIKVELDN